MFRLSAFRLPKETESEKEARGQAIEEATLYAIRVPFEVMKTAFAGFEVVAAMVEEGNPSSVSDAGVGALALEACVGGAWLNVRINSVDLKSHPEVRKILDEGAGLATSASSERTRIITHLEKRLD